MDPGGDKHDDFENETNTRNCMRWLSQNCVNADSCPQRWQGHPAQPCLALGSVAQLCQSENDDGGNQAIVAEKYLQKIRGHEGVNRAQIVRCIGRCAYRDKKGRDPRQWKTLRASVAKVELQRAFVEDFGPL
jgi:hypothetical protein